MKYSKVIVTLIILLNVIFTIAVFWSFVTVHSEPTTLVVAFFAFTTGELWLTAQIKIKDTKEPKDAPKTKEVKEPVRKPKKIEYFD